MTCAAGTAGHQDGRTHPGCHCGRGHRRHRDGHRRPCRDGDQPRHRHRRRAGTRPCRDRHGHHRDGPRHRRHQGHRGRGRRQGRLGHVRAAAACCSGWAAGRRGGPCQPGWGGRDRASRAAAARRAGDRPDRTTWAHPGCPRRAGPGAVRCAAWSPCRTPPGRTGCCPGGARDAGRAGHQAGARPAVGRPDPSRPGRSPGQDRVAARPAAGRAPGPAGAVRPGWRARHRWAPAEPGRAAPGRPGAGPQDGIPVPGRPTGSVLSWPTGWPPPGHPPAGCRQPTGWEPPPRAAAGQARAAARDGCHCRLRPGPAQAVPAAACPGASPGRRTHL